MKKLLIILAILAIIASVGVMKAEAANPDTIVVTVTLREISVLLSADFSFETGMGSTYTKAGAFTTTNNGGMAEDFVIKGSNSTGTTPWTLAGTAGANQFALAVTDKIGTPVQLTTSDKTFGLGVASLGFFSSDITFKAPTSTTDPVGTAHPITLTVTASPAA